MPSLSITSSPSPSPAPESRLCTSVLVTGGMGFLGSFIVNALLEKHPEWNVIVLDLSLPRMAKRGVLYEVGDVTDISSMSKIIDKFRPDVIIHSAGLVPELAGRYGRQDRDRVFNVNVNGTRNMLAAAKVSTVKAFVWTGSCTAVTDDRRYQYANIDERWPTSSQSLVYGESKVYSYRLGQGIFTHKSRRQQLKP